MKIFITGVSSGIGEALAKESLKAGHEVWGVACRPGFGGSIAHRK